MKLSTETQLGAKGRCYPFVGIRQIDGRLTYLASVLVCGGHRTIEVLARYGSLADAFARLDELTALISTTDCSESEPASGCLKARSHGN